MEKNEKNAFTLAETLIALAIIGIIAALTIPSTIINYQKRVKVAKIKKVYNGITQAYVLSFKDNGPIPKETYTGSQNSTKLTAFYEKYLKPYYKVSKFCPPGNTCGYSSNTPFYLLNGQNNGFVFASYANFAFIDSDGVLYRVQPYNGELNLDFDLNGVKGPNKWGKDLFGVHYSEKNGFLPHRFSETYEEINSGCPKSENGRGTGCLTKIIRDGWEIKDDYPW